MSSQVPVIACHQLTKNYSEATNVLSILCGVDFTVSVGEMVAIEGVSGSGKSTLLHLLGGLDKPTSGQVFINQQALTPLSEKAKGRLRNQYLGFVYQFHHLLPEFDATENVELPLLIRGETSRVANEKALEMINKVGLAERATHRISELSGGERQRIAIARALVNEPHCVLADEPSGNLDEHTGQKITELLLKLNETLNTSFVIVTHNKHLASQMQRRLVLVNGRLVEQ